MLIISLSEFRLFAVALLTELITPDTGKSRRVKRKLEGAGNRPIYLKHFPAWSAVNPTAETDTALSLII
jgi:hypothetical protein